MLENMATRLCIRFPSALVYACRSLFVDLGISKYER
jgi:hypothetical protein